MKVRDRRLRLLLVTSALCALGFAGHFDALVVSTSAQAPTAIDSSLLDAYRWRGIGPNRGGRSIACQA